MAVKRRGVLVTRPEPGSGDTAAALIALGWHPVLAPMLRIVPRTTRLPRAAAIQAVLVTSGNALPALGVEAGLRRRPLLAVGDATARRAREVGFETVYSANGDALALATLARARLRPENGPVLLVSGAGQGGMLAALLRENGFGVMRRVGYAAVPVDALPPTALAALSDHTLHAALFFSAETARAFNRALPVAHRCALADCIAIAISAATAAALPRSGFRAVHVARAPKASEVLALL